MLWYEMSNGSKTLWSSSYISSNYMDLPGCLSSVFDIMFFRIDYTLAVCNDKLRPFAGRKKQARNWYGIHVDSVGDRFITFDYRCRQWPERIPGVHPCPENEWRDPWPGGKGKNHARGEARLLGPLHQLWGVLPQRGQVCGEVQRLLMRLLCHGVRRALLHQR